MRVRNRGFRIGTGGRLALLLALFTPAATAFGAVCDVSVDLSVTPRNPVDGGLLTYSLTYCDVSGDGGSVTSPFIAVSSASFNPVGTRWTSCPTANCTADGTGNLLIS